MHLWPTTLVRNDVGPWKVEGIHKTPMGRSKSYKKTFGNIHLKKLKSSPYLSFPQPFCRSLCVNHRISTILWSIWDIYTPYLIRIDKIHQDPTMIPWFHHESMILENHLVAFRFHPRPLAKGLCPTWASRISSFLGHSSGEMIQY